LFNLHLAIYALIQGITEFLPISSQGHLDIAGRFFELPGQGLTLIVAVHVGTLGAVMLFFWRDLAAMFMGVVRALGGRRDRGGRLFLLVVVATLPVIGAGYLVNTYLGEGLHSLAVIGWATLGFGIVLYCADKIGLRLRRMEHLDISDAVIIGFAQILALIPGTSRSGITMSAARMLGFERPDAARFSMLMSIPAILGAGMLKGKELIESGDIQMSLAMLNAAALSFLAAIAAIWLMMAWLRRASFTPFVIYRVFLGIGLLVIAYG
jgi:undecaprenyl-diphosphatase